MIIIIDFEGVKCMKYSKQREALLTLLRSTRSHPSADWLYENLRKEFPNISLGTVYRNLAQLAENGDILKSALPQTKNISTVLSTDIFISYVISVTKYTMLI